MRSLVIPLSLGLGMMAMGSMVAEAKVEQREKFSMNKDVPAQGLLEVENSNGAVTIIGVSDGNQIRISGEKIAGGRTEAEAKEALGKIDVKVVQTGSGLSIRSIAPEDLPPNCGVTYRIEVPRSWEVKVVNANGNVSIGNVERSATAVVANGSVQLDDIVGNLHAQATNGAIRSTGQVPAGGTCTIQTTNGAINAKLVVDPSASCDLKTTNGAISLSLPSSTSADVSATTSMGKISVQGLEFSNKTKQQSMMGSETFNGTLGSGSGRLKLTVMNGGIALKGF